MKLRTDVLLRHDGKHVLCTGRGEICGPDEVSGDPTMLHDAMAAHALLQAMDEAQKDWDAYAEPAPDTIKQRAAEILAGWLGEEVAK